MAVMFRPKRRPAPVYATTLLEANRFYSEGHSLALSMMRDPDLFDAFVRSFGSAASACHELGKVMMSVRDPEMRSDMYRRAIDAVLRLHYENDHGRVFGLLCRDLQSRTIELRLRLCLGARYARNRLNLRTTKTFFEVKDHLYSLSFELHATGHGQSPWFRSFGIEDWAIGHDDSFVPVLYRRGGVPINGTLPRLRCETRDGAVTAVGLGEYNFVSEPFETGVHPHLNLYLELLPRNLEIDVPGCRVRMVDVTRPLLGRITFIAHAPDGRTRAVSRSDAMQLYRLFYEMEGVDALFGNDEGAEAA